MARTRTVPAEHPAFLGLPVTTVTASDAAEPMAVHLAGRLASGRPALVCLAGYNRNSADFSAFLAAFRRHAGVPPVVLVDLKGRGRSADREDRKGYGAIADAADVAAILVALGLETAVFVGMGYGGQVVMALAAERPRAVAGAVLIDAGPVTDSRGLVRLRNNMRHLGTLRSPVVARAVLRQILAADYPGLSDIELDRLGQRTHVIEGRPRPLALFDQYLIERLDAFDYDDVLVAQWPLFDALAAAPLLMMRTQLTDQLRRETFDEMMRRRPDADALVIAGQGSPALLDQPEEVDAVVGFVQRITAPRLRPR